MANFAEEGTDYSFKVIVGPGICTVFFRRPPNRILVLPDIPVAPTDAQCRALLEWFLTAPDYLAVTEEDVVEIVKSSPEDDGKGDRNDPKREAGREPAPKPPYVAYREGICRACGRLTADGVCRLHRICTPCLRNRPGAICPDSPPRWGPVR